MCHVTTTEPFTSDNRTRSNQHLTVVQALMQTLELHSKIIISMMIFLAALGGYVLTSYIFLKFPGLLHKKKQSRFKAVHISHRGGKVGRHVVSTGR